MGHRVEKVVHEEFAVAATLNCSVKDRHDPCAISRNGSAQMVVTVLKLKTYARVVTVRAELSKESTYLEFSAPQGILVDARAWEETRQLRHSDAIEQTQYDKAWLAMDVAAIGRPGQYAENISVRVFYADQWAPQVKIEVTGVALPVIADANHD